MILEEININQINEFWEMFNRYMHEDIIPNWSLCGGEHTAMSEYYFSDTYHNTITTLFQCDKQPVRIGFYKDGDKVLGFAMYVVYNLEDCKGFIMEYCILPEYRNKGLGSLAYQILENEIKRLHGKFIDLTTSNENNTRFWHSHGFEKTNIADSDGEYFFRKLL
ncbi:MAG: GNAT family N-acetyltransferase [Clostridia bacterium]